MLRTVRNHFVVSEERFSRVLVSFMALGFVALVAANFAYIYPILTDQVLLRSQWLARMWFRSWI